MTLHNCSMILFKMYVMLAMQNVDTNQSYKQNRHTKCDAYQWVRYCFISAWYDNPHHEHIYVSLTFLWHYGVSSEQDCDLITISRSCGVSWLCTYVHHILCHQALIVNIDGMQPKWNGVFLHSHMAQNFVRVNLNKPCDAKRFNSCC